MPTLEERLRAAQAAPTLEQRLAKAQAAEIQNPMSTFQDTAINGFFNNLLPIPGEALALGTAALRNIGDVVATPHAETDFLEDFEEERNKFPASFLRKASVENLRAAGEAIPALLPGGQSPGERFDERKAEILDEQQAERNLNPKASLAGDIAGGALTIATGRLPFAKGIGNVDRAISTITPSPMMAFGSGSINAALNTSRGRHVFNAVTKSPRLRMLLRGTGRSVETGAEAAVLDILKGEDPLETAAFAAGGQLGGSAILQGFKGLVSGGPGAKILKLSAAALATGGALQLLDSGIPGGKDFILENIEGGYDKVLLGLTLGVATGMFGGGRIRSSETARLFPLFTDALSSVPRGLVVSSLEEIVDSDAMEQRRARLVLTKLSENPNHFGSVAMRRIDRALNNPQMSFNEELNKLMENEEFANALDALETQ